MKVWRLCPKGFAFYWRRRKPTAPSKDIAHVARGLKVAAESGLVAEFILWFGYEMQHTDDVERAVSHALYEWDL